MNRINNTCFGCMWKSWSIFNGYFGARFMSGTWWPDCRQAQSSWGCYTKIPPPPWGAISRPAALTQWQPRDDCSRNGDVNWKLLLLYVTIHRRTLSNSQHGKRKYIALFKTAIHERCWSRNTFFSLYLE